VADFSVREVAPIVTLHAPTRPALTSGYALDLVCNFNCFLAIFHVLNFPLYRKFDFKNLSFIFLFFRLEFSFARAPGL